jgi:hypothetical protein
MIKLHGMVSDRAGRRGGFETMLAARMARASAALLLCVSLAADAEEPPAKSEAPQTSAETKPDAEATGEFKPPPGFRAKKRGDVTVYCRKEAVLGSRFSAEKCYDQAGIRELKRAELELMEMLEKIRACTTGSCSAG